MTILLNVYLSNAALGLLDKIDKHDDILMPFCDLDGKYKNFFKKVLMLHLHPSKLYFHPYKQSHIQIPTPKSAKPISHLYYNKQIK